MSDRRPENEYARAAPAYTVTCNAGNHDPADLLAAVRRGVESGTIKGEVVETENCGREPNCTCPGFIEHWTLPGTYLLIGPVSDGGSET